jgi:5-methylcytosine-specific restriction endonuclease McrA
MFDDPRWRLAIGNKIGEAAQILRYKKNPYKTSSYNYRRKERLESVEREKYTIEDVLSTWGTNCHICGEEIDLEAPRSVGVLNWERSLHLDHVIPLVGGGPDTLKNVKPAHARCNVIKGGSMPRDMTLLEEKTPKNDQNSPKNT